MSELVTVPRQLLVKVLEHLEERDDRGPINAGWKSDALTVLIADLRRLLEVIP